MAEARVEGEGEGKRREKEREANKEPPWRGKVKVVRIKN